MIYIYMCVSEKEEVIFSTDRRSYRVTENAAKNIWKRVPKLFVTPAEIFSVASFILFKYYLYVILSL